MNWWIAEEEFDGIPLRGNSLTVSSFAIEEDIVQVLSGLPRVVGEEGIHELDCYLAHSSDAVNDAIVNVFQRNK